MHLTRFRITVTAVAVSAAMVAGGALVASSASAAPASTHHAAKPATSPEEVFRGVMFLQGQVGQKIYTNSPLEQASDASTVISQLNTPAAISNANTIVREIKAADPSYLATFDAQVSSGDPYKVSAALTSAKAEIASTPFVKNEPASSSAYVPGEVGPDCVTDVVVGVVLVIAGVVFALAAAAIVTDVAAGYTAVVGENAAESSADSASPATQQWVANVTERMAA